MLAVRHLSSSQSASMNTRLRSRIKSSRSSSSNFNHELHSPRMTSILTKIGTITSKSSKMLKISLAKPRVISGMNLANTLTQLWCTFLRLSLHAHATNGAKSVAGPHTSQTSQNMALASKPTKTSTKKSPKSSPTQQVPPFARNSSTASTCSH